MMRSAFANERGMSTIEIVTILVISGILFATAISRLKDNPAKVQRRNAARVALRDFRYAQEMAITHGKAVRIEIQLDQNRYLIKWAKTGELLPKPNGDGPFIRQFGNNEFLYVTLTGTDLETGNFVFGTSGKPFIAGQELQAAKTVLTLNSTHHLIVLPHTGKIKLQSDDTGE